MKHTRTATRRSFLKTAAAAASLPAWFVEECLARQTPQPAGPRAPSEQVRLALVGCGGQGTGDAKNASRYGKIVAVCDVDANHLAAAQQTFAGAAGYSDFRRLLERKDVDAVICGTVDHWHTLVSMAAMQAGKDVYCEKPLTLTIAEGQRLVEVDARPGACSRPARNSGAAFTSALPATWCGMAASGRSRRSKYGSPPDCDRARSRLHPSRRGSITTFGSARPRKSTM